jgi:hypothetical protein
MWVASIRSSKRKLLKGITARRRSSAISTIHTNTGTALSRLRIEVFKLFSPVTLLDGKCLGEEYAALDASVDRFCSVQNYSKDGGTSVAGDGLKAAT